eukprot:Sdes_comp19324_c0_seq4m10484
MIPEKIEAKYSHQIFQSKNSLQSLSMKKRSPTDDSNFEVVCVDDLGNISTFFFDTFAKYHENNPQNIPSQPFHQCENIWKHGNFCNSSFADVSLHSLNPSQVAVSRFFDKSIGIFDQGKCVRQFHTLNNPTSLAWLPNHTCGNPNLLAITEFKYITILDHRMSESHGVAARAKNLGTSWLQCLDAAENLLVTSGVERVVYALDPRKWAPLNSWKSVLKYDVNFLKFSPFDSRICYAASGVDSEFACGSWDPKLGKIHRLNSSSILKADSRWKGVTIVNHSSCILLLHSFTAHSQIFLGNHLFSSWEVLQINF